VEKNSDYSMEIEVVREKKKEEKLSDQKKVTESGTMIVVLWIKKRMPEVIEL
jgi:hypothetical protein